MNEDLRLSETQKNRAARKDRSLHPVSSSDYLSKNEMDSNTSFDQSIAVDPNRRGSNNNNIFSK